MPDDQETSPSDSELAAAIRELVSDEPVEELYRRHRSAVFCYALACCRDRHTAEDLASEAFARTLRAVRSGGGPEAAWRPYLLTVVRRTAADWAGTARRTELSPDFEQWLANVPDTPEAESGEERMLRLEESSLVLRAFRSLPERWQTVLWHTAVEEEPATKVGPLLGLGASGVGSLASRAREGLREAYLAMYAESASTAEECRRYSSLLGAAVRRTGRRTNKDLDRHLAECERCRAALLELTALNERLGSVLPAGLLLWGGSAYVAARLAESGASAGGMAIAPGAPDGSFPLDGGTGWWARAKGAPLSSGAVAGSVVAAIGVAVLVVPRPFGDDGKGPSPRVLSKPTMTVSTYPPPVTLTATPSKSVSAPPAEHSAAGPASKEPAQPSPTVVDLGPVKWSGRLRNVGLTGMCVEPAGTSLVQNTCDDGKDQVWQTYSFKENKDYTWLRNAATGECIDYRGGTQEVFDNAANVRIRMGPCRAAGDGQLFRFDPWWGESDGSYLVRAELQDGKPWDEMQLGMLDWYEGNDPPPEKDAPVVLTYNYYNAPRLRYRIDVT
ncbi:sigma-70 family RNA polymerase sigma factor [Streptomyces lunaelactis]|uniref:sigma-70 family RNA polymerase sigma factor n=1 Tax=Streptomyces lunaelactis TaxID=1535768 RepID=UPI0015855535|nr:sigma-70 family RNA polymerase sigma factor [Streptomyces lunaelactis]NUK52650.1 sigma-70 family RNA polymerase sigma factor [Streptomyces lunaelactis]NUK66430.1 sigma-70 family RNA polymerase sigma factor [Streptomyces lunaelactis]